MTAPIVISGAASWNRIVLLDRLPEPVPHMQFALAEHETIGGTSAGKALGLVGLGHAVRLHTLIGADADGQRVRRLLEASGIDVDALPADATERHLNLMTAAGERVSLYLSTPGDPGTPASSGLVQAMADAPVLVLDLSERSRALIPTARAAGRPIWTDIHDYDGSAEFHRPFIEAADWIFMNADRIGDDPVPFMEECVRGGASVVVCTLGAQGAVAVDASLAVHRVAAVPVEVVDTNGAGDAFMSGVLDAHLAGLDLDAALEAGARHAATVLTTPHLHPSLDALLAASA
ncbi:sugar/nucleoside kinase (ribokinase family) [Agromyces terreus]|uniref:Sugar/nucleoside kinase (Ribokinase family) n=1 Tax=Agromyces terreus TaxID=424795 RepID=A0A9X2KBR2_9MICO|nr:carbohydrate kinase family protein [Agromyces terreus]MCP2370616.1 sugar/nucleoside kinase (ribokinase family) [Agromyces terreus]